MPFKKEHAARIKSPSGFSDFRRVPNLDDGVDAIVGIKDGKSTIQSIRFDKTKFSETQAKKWLEKNRYVAIKFEPAISGQGDFKMPYHDDKEKDKDMEKKEKEMEIPNPTSPDKMEKEKYAMDDLYTDREEAEKAAPAMGLEGAHTHEHRIDGKNVEFFMPGKNHEEYLKAKAEMEAKDNEDKDKDKEKDMMDKDKEEKMEDEDKDKKMEDEKKMEDKDEDEDEKKMSKGDDCDCEEEKEICDDSCEEDSKEHSIKQSYNLDGIEIFSTGVWNGDKYTKKDLQAMVNNFSKTGFEPPIKLGHNEEQPEMKDGEPALGYIDKIYMVGTKLLADFKEIPQVLYDAMKRGNYKRVSSEIYWNYKNNGSVLDRVLKAVAILGSEIPAVSNLEAIQGLYSKEVGEGQVKQYYSEKESELMEQDISKEYQQLQEKVKSLEEANKKAYSELEEINKAQKEKRISDFVSEQKESGRVLPNFEKELNALLSSATDTKVYSYSKGEETIELSQIDLVEKIFSSMPKLIEFGEISDEGEFVVDRQPYEIAGDEVDRRANLYITKGKAKNYSEALELVFKEDEQLKKEYYETR
tara:strand:+ start:875 stop:2617 length:1743 start_codon:yes stop_codon:yes gene_type:complete